MKEWSNPRIKLFKLTKYKEDIYTNRLRSGPALTSLTEDYVPIEELNVEDTPKINPK